MAPEADTEDPELRSLSYAQAVAVLQGVPYRHREQQDAEFLAIRNARDCGVTWRHIADALGLESAEAAEQQHEKLEKRVSEAQAAESHCMHIRELAAGQRASAAGLRDAVADACDAGVTWRAIGEALGIPHETAFRQFKAGSPIVVVKAFQSAPGAEGDPGPIEVGR